MKRVYPGGWGTCRMRAERTTNFTMILPHSLLPFNGLLRACVVSCVECFPTWFAFAKNFGEDAMQRSGEHCGGVRGQELPLERQRWGGSGGFRGTFGCVLSVFPALGMRFASRPYADWLNTPPRHNTAAAKCFVRNVLHSQPRPSCSTHHTVPAGRTETLQGTA